MKNENECKKHWFLVSLKMGILQWKESSSWRTCHQVGGCVVKFKVFNTVLVSHCSCCLRTLNIYVFFFQTKGSISATTFGQTILMRQKFTLFCRAHSWSLKSQLLHFHCEKFISFVRQFIFIVRIGKFFERGVAKNSTFFIFKWEMFILNWERLYALHNAFNSHNTYTKNCLQVLIEILALKYFLVPHCEEWTGVADTSKNKLLQTILCTIYSLLSETLKWTHLNTT